MSLTICFESKIDSHRTSFGLAVKYSVYVEEPISRSQTITICFSLLSNAGERDVDATKATSRHQKPFWLYKYMYMGFGSIMTLRSGGAVHNV